MQNKPKYIFLNTPDELFMVDSSKIVYFESDGNYTKFVLKNKLKGVVCMNLTQIGKILNQTLDDTAPVFVRLGSPLS